MSKLFFRQKFLSTVEIGPKNGGFGGNFAFAIRRRAELHLLTYFASMSWL